MRKNCYPLIWEIHIHIYIYREREVTKVKETVLRDFLFADDCSLNTSDEQEMQDEMYSLSPACDNFGLTIPYLPVYNAHPYFGLHFGKKKKKEAENRGSGYERIA